MSRLGRVFRSMRAFSRELTRAADVPKTAAPTIGLALGGGFARGIAHIGVLKVLEEANITVQFVTGTSVGALIGAVYCSGLSAAEMEEIALRVRMKHLAKWTVSRFGMASNQRMAVFLNGVLKHKRFEDLRIPLGVVATDIGSGQSVVVRSGELADAVRASCAYPGMFLPVEVSGRLLVDGMLAHAVPSIPAREMGAQRVLAVHLKGNYNGTSPRHVFDVIGQCFSIAQEKMSGEWKQASDVIVEPEMSGFKYDDFERSAEMIAVGEAAMRKALPRVQAWLKAQATEYRVEGSGATGERSTAAG
jgi:NTE family protein